MTSDIPVMRRPAGQQAHPLLVDQVVYVLAGRSEAETERRIADACAVSGIDPARAVACVAAPPGGKQGAAKGSARTETRKPTSGPDFAPTTQSEEAAPCHSPT